MHVSPKTEIYLYFSIKNAGFVFAVEINDFSVFAYNFYVIINISLLSQALYKETKKCSQKFANLTK